MGTDEAGDRAEGRALSGAVGPDQGNDLPLFHLKGNSLERLDAAIGNHQIRYFQQAHSSSTPR